MVYSPPSNQHKFPHSSATPHVVSNEIDAGAIKLQPPKIRPITRSSPKRARPTLDDWNRPAMRAVSQDEAISDDFRTSTTASTVEILTTYTGPISAPTVENLNHRVEVIRSIATMELHENACEAVRAATASADANGGAITVWETPYNKPAIESLENVQYTRLALQYLQQGRIEDAERLYKQALVVAERTFAAGDPAISRAAEDLATFYYGHGKFKQAEPFVSRLLKQRVEALPCDDWLLIRTVDQLADIYEKCGESIQAQALYKLLLARQEETLGRKSSVCAFTLSRLADCYLRQEHFSAAESLFQTILGIQETLHGRCSIEISTTLQELAGIYQKIGLYDRAAEMLERLLHVLEFIHGDNGLSVASCLLKLADLLTEVEMVSEAEPLYRRAQEIYRLSYGERTAAHSMFKKKLERVTETINISRLSKDKPIEQEQCSRFPAIRLTLDDMLPAKLGTGQINRCLGHAVSSNGEHPPVSAANRVDTAQPVETSQTLEMPVRPLKITAANIDLEVSEFDFSVTSAMIAPMFEDIQVMSEEQHFVGGETLVLSRPEFSFDKTLELSRPEFSFDKTLELSRLEFDFDKTLELSRSEFNFDKTLEWSRPESFDFEPATDLWSDFGKTAELPGPPLDLMVAPTFDFTPSFEANTSIFESADRSFDGVSSKFESNGELDSILDPFFASELASIYEATTANRDVLGNEVALDQQDTLLDLEPSKTLSLPRPIETKERSQPIETYPRIETNERSQPIETYPRIETNERSRSSKAAPDSKIAKLIGAERAAKPRRLADKTVSMPRVSPLDSRPRLSTQVPGLVTITATDALSGR